MALISEAHKSYLITAKEFFISATLTSGSAVLSLGFSAVSSIFLVRYLSTEDYARYTIAFGAYQTIQLLADSGISNAVSNEARSNWQSPDHVASTIKAGRMVRRPIISFVYLACFAFMIFFMMKHGASGSIALVTSLLVIISSWMTNESSLISIPLYFHQRIFSLQIAGVLSDFLRMALIFSAVFLLRYDYIAIGVFTAGFAFKYFILKHSSRGLIGKNKIVDPDTAQRILKFVQNIRPVWIYACFSGSITIFLASIFGKTFDLAAVGGLGRLGVLTGIGGFVFNSLITPRFCRVGSSGNLRVRFYQSYAALLLINTLSVLPFVLFPVLGLKLLGEKYSHLQSELQISCFGSWIYGMYAGIYSLSIGRGHLVKPWLYLTLVVLWQLLLISTFNLHTLHGLLWIGALTHVPGVIGYFIASFNGLRREESKVEWNTI